MRLFTLITTAGSLTATAFAGTSKEVIAPATPPPAPSLGGWFIGGTYGQLDGVGNTIEDEFDFDRLDVSDLDFDMYTLHVGRDLGRQVLGCDIAVYLEVGYLDGEMSISRFNSFDGPNAIRFDVEIIPITANVKIERPLFGPVSGYLTGGLGGAFTDISAGSEGSEDGSGFYAQASAGLLYNINQQCEVYAGARWVYLNDLDFGDAPFELDDEIGWEVGFRYNF